MFDQVFKLLAILSPLACEVSDVKENISHLVITIILTIIITIVFTIIITIADNWIWIDRPQPVLSRLSWSPVTLHRGSKKNISIVKTIQKPTKNQLDPFLAT